jgi:hypothetical protein
MWKLNRANIAGPKAVTVGTGALIERVKIFLRGFAE